MYHVPILLKTKFGLCCKAVCKDALSCVCAYRSLDCGAASLVVQDKRLVWCKS